MSGNKSPKTIATINFKGGVGKTTISSGSLAIFAAIRRASSLVVRQNLVDVQIKVMPGIVALATHS
jgi:MinD-like ATPase involved in chromosome partitioning or flagellar assembly